MPDASLDAGREEPQRREDDPERRAKGRLPTSLVIPRRDARSVRRRAVAIEQSARSDPRGVPEAWLGFRATRGMKTDENDG
jgi:hypothetical protein